MRRWLSGQQQGASTGADGGAVRVAGRTQLDLPGEVTSVGAARSLVRRSLDEWGLSALGDTAALLVSELATNAVLHARSGFTVTVEHRDDTVRVTVHDESPAAPARRRNGLQAATGRGLALVDTMATDWGRGDSDAGRAKGVWFELSTDLDEQPNTDEGALYGDQWLAVVEDL